MKRHYLPIFLFILLIVPIALSSCLSPAATAPTAATAGVTKQVTELEAKVKTLTEENAKQATSIAELQTNKLSKSEYTPASNTYAKTELYTRAETYTRTEIDAAIATAINAYKATIPNNQQPQQGITPTGTITYTIQNPAVMGLYQLNTASNISIRIFNNKSEARYIRPQITLTSYNGANNGTISPCTATVISNSMGQAAVVFSANPIPAGASTQVLFIAASGGVSNGQYLLSAGNAMDILITIQATGTLNSLWNLSITGSDVSSTTGM